MDPHAEESIEARLKEWAVELEQLKAKVDRDMAESKRQYYEQVEELRRTVEAQLLKWSYELEDLKAKTSRPDLRDAIGDLRRRLEDEVKAWGPQLELLKSRAAKAESEAKRMLDEFQARRQNLQQDLSALKGKGEAAWGDVRTGIGKAWDELKTAFKTASDKFK